MTRRISNHPNFSPSNSSLPSPSGSGSQSAISLIHFTMPSVLILENGTPELEYICLPPNGMSPPNWSIWPHSSVWNQSLNQDISIHFKQEIQPLPIRIPLSTIKSSGLRD
ncbi:hypothetical protein O181_097253 [Austropuccinia psidii MF-1]|uniref:Uncharacterized protein n=1 Tax=Austropuccinia psidii MF-1 TaxID=1389203 RepID=A0A9Q3PD00_9BASI|nr:hypothetical protein [Austropuccinia psidii MF-1]